MSSSTKSVYAAIGEPGSVTTVTDGDVTLLDSPTQAKPAGAWAAVWYEDETYADTCHDASPDVHVAHHDWSLWRADLEQEVGRADDLDLVRFAREIRGDLDALGPAGRAELTRDAHSLLDTAAATLDDSRALAPLVALARRIIDGTAPRDPGAELEPSGNPVGLVLPDGAIMARVVTVDDTDAKIHAYTPEESVWNDPYWDVVTLPRTAVLLVLPEAVGGEDGRVHHLGDDCGHHETVTRGEEARLSCGRDFMAGTI